MRLPILVGAVVVLSACNGGSRTPTTPTPPATVTLSGVVLVNGIGLAGATVTLMEGSNANQSATTNAAGR
jgi:hypothetical protein